MSHTRKDVLNGWKDIAAYLGRDRRTVERWEKQRALPVRRYPGGGRSSVYALTSELDAWLGGRLAELDERIARVADDVSAPVSLPGESASPQPIETPATTPEPAVPGSLPYAPQGDPRRYVESWRKWVFLLAVLLVAAALLWLGFQRIHPPQGVSPSSSGREPAPMQHLAYPPSKVAGVEEEYLRGVFEAELRTPEQLSHARQNLSTAIAQDPEYAPAYAALGVTDLLSREYAAVPDAEAYPAARAAAEHALALNPNLAQAHAVLGFVDYFWSGTPSEAERQFRVALQRRPDLSIAHHWYGSVLLHEGRFDEGLRELNVAQAADPGSLAILTSRALALGLCGNKAKGAELLREGVRNAGFELQQVPVTVHRVLGDLALLPPRDIQIFLSEALLTAQLLHQDRTVDELRKGARAYHSGGEHAMWQAMADEERRYTAGHAAGSYRLAGYETELGSKQQALHDLAAMYAHKDPSLSGMSMDPMLAGLRGDPQFEGIRSALGLPAVVWR